MSYIKSGAWDAAAAATQDKTLTVPSGIVASNYALVTVAGSTPIPTGITSVTSSNAGAVITQVIAPTTVTNMYHFAYKVTGVKAGDTIRVLLAGTSGGFNIHTHHYFETDFVIGSQGTRGGVSQTFVAAPTKTVAAGARITLISHERTLAIPTTVASIVNSNGRTVTQRYYQEADQPGGSSSTLVAEFDEPTTATGTTTATYSGGSGNAVAYHVEELAPALVAYPGMSMWDGATEKPVAAKYWDGTKEVDLDGRRPVPYKINTVTTFMAQQPLFIAHRGGSNSWPEMTQYAYRKASAWPMKALEISCFRSSDGVWVASHDASTLRVTGVDYTIANTTWATLSSLTVTAAGTNNTGQARQPLSRVQDILDDFAKDHVIFIEDKSYANADSLLDLIGNYADPSEHFIWKCYGPSTSTGATKAKTRYNLKSWAYYFNGSDMTNLFGSGAVNAQRYDLLGIDYNCSDADVTAAIALGKPTTSHILTTSAQRDRMQALGCIGHMSADIQAVVPPQIWE